MAGCLARLAVLLGMACAVSAVTQAQAPPGPGGPFDCIIEPSAVVELSAPVVGVVSEMLVDRGDRVQRGQLVARLQDATERANLAVALQRTRSQATLQLKRERLAFEERRLARNDRLIGSNILTEKEADEIRTSRELARWELQDAEEQAALAKLQLKQVETDLSLREVRSPIDGVVIERDREPGETTANAHVLKIAQLDPLHVEAFVPAQVVAGLAAGEAASVAPESAPDRRLQGRIKIIDKVADAASGMVKVRITVSNDGYSELSGLRCSVSFAAAAGR